MGERLNMTAEEAYQNSLKNKNFLEEEAFQLTMDEIKIFILE